MSNASAQDVVDLTPEQDAIARASSDERRLVIAGAGTGKTHVLIERLAFLADESGLSLADEVLVLSFSRAAVWEVKRRMRARGGSVPYGTVVTFDSFATRLLAQYSPDQSWSTADFDGRISAATALLLNSTEAKEGMGRLRHVIVDEVQDLVGLRRELVQALLACSGHGFTLFGDPAQSIYNFQAHDPAERQLGSLVLFDWIRRRLPGAPVRTSTLDHNFRHETTEAKIADWAGPELNGAAPDYARILERLEDGILDTESLGGVDEFVEELAGRAQEGTLEGSIGVLCDYNVEVLRMSQRLAAAHVVHHYQRSALDRTVPSWVGRVLRSCESTRLGMRSFATLAAEVEDAPNDAWILVKRFDPTGNRDSLDIQRVQERIRLGDIPADFATPPSASVVVSTVHRAKGLEFDRVVLFEPGPPLDADDEELPERTRRLYVALTRARRRYGWLERPPREYADKRHNPGQLWVVRGFAGPRRYVKELEIQGSYSWKQDPAGAFAFDGNAEEIQQYIATEVKPLDPLSLRRVRVADPAGARMYYVIEHDGRDVGVVDIGWVIKVLCRPRDEHNWPSSIQGLYVESVDTVAGTSAAGSRAGLTSSGLWLRVRPYGLGRLCWEQK